MKKLVCELCGGSLIMNSDNIAECENCGMKYAKEKVAQMVKIEGAVEVTKGDAEKERLLKNVETYLTLEKYIQAYELCQRIINEYPNEYRGWYLAFKSIVYVLTNNISLSKSVTVSWEDADSNLKTAIKLSNNKEVLGKEAIIFWFDALKNGTPDLPTLYLFCNVCEDNHIVSIFLKKVDEQISLLVKKLNFYQNKKDICEKLNFQLCVDETTNIKRIDFFSFKSGFIYADGIIVRKEFDGLTFWGQKDKWKYIDIDRKGIYRLRINSFNELQELVKRVSV